MPKTEAFDRFSKEYDDWFGRHDDLYRAELETIRQLMPPPGSEMIEVGVGSGKFAAPLEIQTGVEPSEPMAIRASECSIEVHRGTAEKLPFEDERFDGVLMITTICFVDDPLLSFREALRVLRDGGCILVGFIDKESELGKSYAANREKSLFYREAVFYSAPEVLQLLREAGFTITAVRQSLIPGKTPETILDGFGQGAFIAVKGVKMTKRAAEPSLARQSGKESSHSG